MFETLIRIDELKNSCDKLIFPPPVLSSKKLRTKLASNELSTHRVGTMGDEIPSPLLFVFCLVRYYARIVTRKGRKASLTRKVLRMKAQRRVICGFMELYNQASNLLLLIDN